MHISAPIDCLESTVAAGEVGFMIAYGLHVPTAAEPLHSIQFLTPSKTIAHGKAEAIG
jgi:hypothetical protein